MVREVVVFGGDTIHERDAVVVLDDDADDAGGVGLQGEWDEFEQQLDPASG